MFIERIQRPAQHVVVEVRRPYPRSDQPLGGLVGEKLGHQLQRPVDKPQPVEHQRLDRLTYRYLALRDVLRDRPIHDLANAQCVVPPRDQPQVIEILTAKRCRQDRSSLAVKGTYPIKKNSFPSAIAGSKCQMNHAIINRSGPAH